MTDKYEINKFDEVVKYIDGRRTDERREATRLEIDQRDKIEKLEADKAELLRAYKELVKECLDNFVYIPEHRKTAEEYYWQELEFIEKMEANDDRP